jgi:hypothetical protein
MREWVVTVVVWWWLGDGGGGGRRHSGMGSWSLAMAGHRA